MRVLAVLLLVLVWQVPAAAQQRSDEKTPEQRCLRHEGGPDAQPQYPAAAYNANAPGRVQVALVFSGPDTRPTVRVLLHEGQDEFLQSVREHVRGLRVPCMAAGSVPVELRQTYDFEPDRRQVHWSDAIDSRTRAAGRIWSCLLHASGFRAPEYPLWARRQGVQGRVVLRLSFDKPDAPPKVEAFSRNSTRRLADDLADWAQGYRLPCLEAPASTLMTYVFMLSEAGETPGYGFRDVTFMQVLSNAVGIRQQTMAMDTQQMGCPFDLWVHYLQPQLPNGVGEPGEPVPARRPLIEWLEKFEWDLSSRTLDAAFGDRFKLTVPCIKIDLKPKEK
jgi:hypothetical protein